MDNPEIKKECLTCALFGHRDSPPAIRGAIHRTLNDLILNRGVTAFLVGHNGSFDRMALAELREMKRLHTHISYRVVLCAVPTAASLPEHVRHDETIFPEGLENVPPRFAVDRRNRLMIAAADMVAVYSVRPGGASNAVACACRMKREIIHISD